MTPDSHPALAQWVALSLIPALGGRTLDRLLDHFGTLDAILAASESELRAVRGIGRALAAAIRAIDLAETRAALAAWQADGIAILARDDTDYPLALRLQDDAPPVLFVRGDLAPQDVRAVAIVGTRRPTRAASEMAATLAAALAARGWTIVSGLAAGIDTAAHCGALRAGGRTLAVLGSGVRVPYSPQNRALAARIVAQGALLAEVHPDAAPSSPALVARNRLISGLSRAVIVVEAGNDSGSRHAARFARAQGRRVYAVQNGSPGNKALLDEGAIALPADFDGWDRLSRELGAGPWWGIQE